MMQSLAVGDVRSLLQLLGELRELGSEPAAWRQHLAARLEQLCGAEISAIAELRVNEVTEDVTSCAEAVTPLELVDHGIDSSCRDQFYERVFFVDHATDDALQGMMRLYGSSFTVRREEIVPDRQWDRSMCANERFRSHGCDDFVMSMAPVWDLKVISSINIFRGSGARFTGRENALVSLLHEELAKDWRSRRAQASRLTARQQQVLERLKQGASEKEIASELGVSIHTTHDHVKAIYRAYGARSRGELLARFATAKAPTTRLVSEAALSH